MKTFEVYGTSDDSIEASGIEGADEFYADYWRNEYCQGIIKLRSGTDVMAIYCFYTPSGVWCFAPSQVEGGSNFPNWPIEITQYINGYSTLLKVKVPDDTICYFDFEGK